MTGGDAFDCRSALTAIGTAYLATLGKLHAREWASEWQPSRADGFSRSFLRSANVLLQKYAILRNAARIQISWSTRCASGAG